jgi:hypothetical protein
MLPAFGYAVREQVRSILDDPAITAVEITFERADDPLRIDRYLGDREFEYVSVHTQKLSVGSPDLHQQPFASDSQRLLGSAPACPSARARSC